MLHIECVACCKEYKFMKWFTYSIITFLALGSIYVICRVNLGWLWFIGYSERANNINKVLENLSYSYLAGCIFYVLTSTVPTMLRTRKIRPLIHEYISNIYGKLNECKKSVLTTSEYNTRIPGDDEFVSRLKSTSLYSPCALSCVYNGIGIGPYMKRMKIEILKEIDDVLKYKEYMTDEEVVVISNLKNSTFLNLLKTVSDTNICASQVITALDNENIRTNIATSLIDDLRKVEGLL